MTDSLDRAGIANADVLEVEITPEMIEAGEGVILGAVGGADLGGYFSARDLAAEVYLAMARVVRW